MDQGQLIILAILIWLLFPFFLRLIVRNTSKRIKISLIHSILTILIGGILLIYSLINHDPTRYEGCVGCGMGEAVMLVGLPIIIIFHGIYIIINKIRLTKLKSKTGEEQEKENGININKIKKARKIIVIIVLVGIILTVVLNMIYRVMITRLGNF